MHNGKLINVTTNTKTYIKTLKEIKDDNRYIELGADEYWQFIPDYKRAECPFCGESYYESIDTYSLKKWVIPTDGEYIFTFGGRVKRCEHYFISQRFINFNDNIPIINEEELNWYKDFNSEVPHIIPQLLSDDFKCYAVMHSLPICKIQGEQFIPTYSLYMISYFVNSDYDRNCMMEVLKNYQPDFSRNSLLIWPFKGPQQNDWDEWWNLKKYVEKGKLFWLEPDNLDLPLIKCPVERFPYGDIKGRKWPYIKSIPDN